MAPNQALILVDLQNDFCKQGSLEVPNGDEVIPIANLLQPFFPLVIASKDWHVPDHISFASQHPGYHSGDKIMLQGIEQELWPDHCIQGTKGSEFHPQLRTEKIEKIIYKGTQKDIDSYSVFFDNAHRNKTEMDEFLKRKAVKELYIMGLATEYCVKYSCLDAVSLGYTVFVIEDGCRGVELTHGNIERAKNELRDLGVQFAHSKEIF